MQLRTLAIGVAIVFAAGPALAAGPKTGSPTNAVKGGAPKTHGNPHSAPSAPTGATTTGTTTTGTTTTTAPAPATTQTPLNPIAQKIASKPNLSNRIQTMLPSGMTLNQASQGFKNQGQFIAALHVSQNLNIPFRQLRNQMVVQHKSLGQSIQTLKGTDGSRAAADAERQATADLNEK
jgi:hypothetical protein